MRRIRTAGEDARAATWLKTALRWIDSGIAIDSPSKGEERGD